MVLLACFLCFFVDRCYIALLPFPRPCSVSELIWVINVAQQQSRRNSVFCTELCGSRFSSISRMHAVESGYVWQKSRENQFWFELAWSFELSRVRVEYVTIQSRKLVWPELARTQNTASRLQLYWTSKEPGSTVTWPRIFPTITRAPGKSKATSPKTC